jgi:uncharacterized protein (TIGR00255 family)
VKSMTGFAFREEQNSEVNCTIEIRSYNNRYLDIVCNTPSFLSQLEPMIRESVTSRVNRGRIELGIRIRELHSPVEVRVARESVQQFMDALQELRLRAGLSDPVRLDHLLGFSDLFSVEKVRSPDYYAEMIRPLLESTLEEFEKSREREGHAARDSILVQMERLETGLKSIETRLPDIRNEITAHFKERFRELVGEQLDENRVYAEVGVLLVKASINEEISRIRSHLDEMRSSLEREGSIGKKLDFICQELNRELNTASSKSFVYEISRHTVEMRDALENIREQARNLE